MTKDLLLEISQAFDHASKKLDNATETFNREKALYELTCGTIEEEEIRIAQEVLKTK